MDKRKELELKTFAEEIKLETIKQIGIRGFGHLGGSLSVADTLAVLYGEIMNIDPQNPKWEDRDLLVMSKGHAGPAVYSTLALKGYFPLDWLKTLNQPGTKLPSHCDRLQTPGVDMTTGSLGQGSSTATGMALGKKLDGSNSRVYLFVGDGECNEGQVWEAAMFAAQQKLDNMIWFVDYNGKQLDGYVKDVLDIGDVKQKFADFGFYSQDVDGHSISEIYEAIKRAQEVKDKPSCIVLHTIKGHGVPEIEEMELNHHIRMNDKQIEEATKISEARLLKLKEELNV